MVAMVHFPDKMSYHIYAKSPSAITCYNVQQNRCMSFISFSELTCILNNPCMNGATCNEVDPNSDAVTCMCPVGYTGENCETRKC